VPSNVAGDGEEVIRGQGVSLKMEQLALEAPASCQPIYVEQWLLYPQFIAARDLKLGCFVGAVALRAGD